LLEYTRAGGEQKKKKEKEKKRKRKRETKREVSQGRRLLCWVTEGVSEVQGLVSKQTRLLLAPQLEKHQVLPHILVLLLCGKLKGPIDLKMVNLVERMDLL